MREEPKEIPIEVMTERLRLLPRRLRIAHLRALIGQQIRGSGRARELAALLRDERTAWASEGGRLR